MGACVHECIRSGNTQAARRRLQLGTSYSRPQTDIENRRRLGPRLRFQNAYRPLGPVDEDASVEVSLGWDLLVYQGRRPDAMLQRRCIDHP